MQNHFETPEEIQAQIYKELVRATHDRHHAWRTPVLATSATDGIPNARTVVLRKVNPAQNMGVSNSTPNNPGGTLEIYTDRRSPKVTELQQQPEACLVFWSARLSWQLRVKVSVSIQTEGPYVESLWQTVKQTRAAGDYLGLLAPGQRLDADSEHVEPSSASMESDVHFAVLSAQINEIDWLELGRGQHRRARMGSLGDNTGWEWEWLQP